MLHKKLISKLNDPALIDLYKHHIKIEHPQIRTLLSNKIYVIKNAIAGADQLKNKLLMHGNCGKWAAVRMQDIISVRETQMLHDKIVPETYLGQWRSIEFELLFSTKQKYEKFYDFILKNKFHNHVTVKHDGSIHGAGVAKEIVVTYRKGEEDIVKKICDVFAKVGYVNETCGTHVHFDMRNYKQAEAIKLAKNLAYCVPALKMILPSTRRANRFCETNINSITSKSRYSFVNVLSYAKYKTIEVRGHSGTIKADDILNWIALCEHLMFFKIKPKDRKLVSTIEDLNARYDLDANIKKYIEKRYKKYNGPDSIAYENE